MKKNEQKNVLYEEGKIAVDAVIFTIKDQKLWVYLDTREIEPYKGLAELAGGLLLNDETAEERLQRKLESITGSNDIFFEQFHTFTDPKRDPRGRVISIGYIALISSDKVKNHENFYEFSALPQLAFDHKEIIETAFTYLQQNLDHQFVRQFMPAVFPLNELQMVHEVIGQKKLDNRNFRKKILNAGILKEVKEVQKNVAHRPAGLYRFGGV